MSGRGGGRTWHRHLVHRGALPFAADEQRAVAHGERLALRLCRQGGRGDLLPRPVVDLHGRVGPQGEPPVRQVGAVGDQRRHVGDAREPVRALVDGAQPPRRAVEPPGPEGLGGHKEPAGPRVHEQRLRVVGPVGVGEAEPRRAHRAVAETSRLADPEDRHVRARAPVVPDVAEEQRRPARVVDPRCERLRVVGVDAREGDGRDRPPAAVDGADLGDVPAVGVRPEDTVVPGRRGQAAGLQQRRVLQAQQRHRPAGREQRGGGDDGGGATGGHR